MPAGEELADGFALAVADFEGEEAAGGEGGVGLGDEAGVDVEASGAGEEGVAGSWSRTWGWRVSRSVVGT